MSDRNEVTLSGRIASSREIPMKEPDRCGLRLSLEVAQGGSGNRSDKFSVLVWDGLAERLKELSPGDRVMIQGRLKRSSWLDKTSGERRWDTEVIATEAARDVAVAQSERI